MQSAQKIEPGQEHAARAVAAFNRACQLTGLSNAELCRRLSPMMGRTTTMSRQTMAARRRGRQQVPLVAFLAACDVAELRPPLIFSLAADESTKP